MPAFAPAVVGKSGNILAAFIVHAHLPVAYAATLCGTDVTFVWVAALLRRKGQFMQRIKYRFRQVTQPDTEEIWKPVRLNLGWYCLAAALACLGAVQGVNAAEQSDVPPAIRIDVPVKLENARVVFLMDHPAFSGDMPTGLKYMQLLTQRMKEMDVKGHVVAIFYNETAYMTLNDKAYNAFRKVSTGNPYKTVLLELLNQGVQVEECGYSMKVNRWTNDDLLPGVKVNTGAIGRTIDLVQQGYVHLKP
ncbi:MAG TPA: DsrE family protein [Clostridia bacterium]|nr:DsrE family protein [Clostridia bacterium]